MAKVDQYNIERLAKISDELDEEDAEKIPGKVLRHALKSQIETLEDQRYEKTKENIEEMSESEEIEAERERLSETVFSTSSGSCSKHSPIGKTEKIRGDEETEEEELSDEVSAKQRELSEKFF